MKRILHISLVLSLLSALSFTSYSQINAEGSLCSNHAPPGTIPEKFQRLIIKWKKVANFPQRLSEISAINYKKKVYVFGGKITNDNFQLEDNEDVNFTYKYDHVADFWTKMTNMLSPRYDVALATANDKIYTISTTNEAYDPVADTWQIKAPLLNGVAHLDAVAVDGKIYVFSAEKPELMNRNIMYNPQTNNWIGRAPIPTPRLFNKAAVVNNKIYVMGGVGVDRNNRLGPAVHVVEVYDLATDSWEIKNPLPDSTFLIEGAVVIKNYIFVLGVVQGSHLMDCQSTPKVYYYNVQTDEWYRTTDLPGNSFSSSGITSIDNQIYVIGGHDSNFKQCNDVFIGEVVIDTSIGGK